MDFGERLATDVLEQLLNILDECGHKSLIIDKDLSPLISSISPFSVLKSHGVDQIHWLSDDLDALEGNIIYLARGHPKQIRQVAEHARKSLQKKSILRLISVPADTSLVQWLLEEAGVLGDITVYPLEVYFGKIGPNLSLFTSGSDDLLIGDTAAALARLQYKFGAFGRISGFGPRAKQVSELLLDNTGELQANDAIKGGFNYKFGKTFVGGHIDHLILIDRNVDAVTPLLSQLSYHGLIDDIYGITSPGITTLPGGQKVKLSDDLFSSIADLNFGQVGQELNQNARQLQSEVDASHNAQSVSEIKDYVYQKLERHRIAKANIKMHTEITEDIMAVVKSRAFDNGLTLQQSCLNNELSTWDAITKLQELIYQGCTADEALRLASLICICRHGVKEKYLHMIFDTIVRTYGYQYLGVIQQLRERNLLFVRSNKTSFGTYARHFKLNNDEPLANTYAGYVPLSTRLTQTVLSGGNVDPRVIDTVFDNIQKSENAREAKLRRILMRNTPGHEDPVVMVFFIGGVSYSEAASIRMLESVLDTSVNIVVATTDMITGKSFIGL